MSKVRTINGKGKSKGLVLGLGAFEKISAVEGVRLTAEMKRDLRALDSQRMSASERTRFITGKYGKKPA